MARLYSRVGFALKDRFLCQSGDLRFGAMIDNSGKGGQRYGRRDSEVV
jgi:hypothetical protein